MRERGSLCSGVRHCLWYVVVPPTDAHDGARSVELLTFTRFCVDTNNKSHLEELVRSPVQPVVRRDQPPIGA